MISELMQKAFAAFFIALLFIVTGCGKPTISKVEFGLGTKGEIVDTPVNIVSKDFKGLLTYHITWSSNLPSGTEIKFLWEMNKDGKWIAVFDPKSLSMDGKHYGAYSNYLGAKPMEIGAWRVSVSENGTKLREAYFTVQ